MNFRYRLMQFMSGRNGPDLLTFVSFVLAAVVSFINIILRFFANRWVLLSVQLVVYTLIGYAVFRVMSRNISARRKENGWFITKITYIKRKRELTHKRKADKCHVYKKCPKCKAVLRLPHRVGVHKTVCPRCQKEFTVRVRK